MDMIFFPLVFIILIFAGVWGSMIISARLKRLPPPPSSGATSETMEELRDGNRQLEARVERIEEELGFLRELYETKPSTRLAPPEDSDSRLPS